MFRLVLICLISVWLIAPASAEKRIALIIANSEYATTGWDLLNPANDAVLMRSALEQIDFEVHTLVDGDRADMERAFQAHGERLKAAGPDATGFFYFAGHGVQSEGLNYLVPTDAVAYSEADIWAQAPRLENLFRHLRRAGNARNFVVLDACRNNPLMSSTRDVSGGLATISEANSMLIAYATSPGSVAEDGATNSPYTTVLASLITQPGQSVETLFRRVRTRVELNTNHRQRPWIESGLSGDADYCFAGCAQSFATGGSEAAAALRALNSGMLSDLQNFLTAYPNSSSRSLVQREIALMEDQSRASAGELASAGRSLTPSIAAPQENERWEQYAGMTVPGCETDPEQHADLCMIEKISWSPDGALIATVTSDGMVRLFDPITGQEVSNWSAGYEISATDIAWGPDSKQIAVSSLWSNSVRIFDARRLSEIGQVDLQGAGALRWDAKSRQLIVAHTEGVSLVYFEGDQLVASSLTGNEHDVEDIRDIAAEGDALIVAGETASEPRAAFIRIGGDDEYSVLNFPARTGPGFASRHVASVDIAPSRTLAAIGTFDGRMYTFDLETGNVVQILLEGETSMDDYASAINAIDWSPDGQRILVTDEEPRVRIFDAETNALVATLETNKYNAEDAAFGPGSDRIAVSSIDGTFRLWRLIED